MLIDLDKYYKVIVHENPAWESRTDYIFHAEFDVQGKASVEQLWGKTVGEELYELCCIPFFVSDISLGDIVRVQSGMFERLERKCGRRVLRIFFDSIPVEPIPLIEFLQQTGCLVERNIARFYAIDIKDEPTLSEVMPKVLEAFNEGILDYELV